MSAPFKTSKGGGDRFDGVRNDDDDDDLLNMVVIKSSVSSSETAAAPKADVLAANPGFLSNVVPEQLHSGDHSLDSSSSSSSESHEELQATKGGRDQSRCSLLSEINDQGKRTTTFPHLWSFYLS